MDWLSRLKQTTEIPLVVDNKPSTDKSTHNPKGGGGANLTSAEIVESEALVGAIWRNPHKQGTPEARRESLIVLMESISTE